MMTLGWLFHLFVSKLSPEKACPHDDDFKESQDCATCRSSSDDDHPTVEDVKTVMKKLGFETSDDREAEEDEEEGECHKCGVVREVCRFLEEKEASLDELRRAFVLFDKNGDGFIAAEELGSVLMALGFSEGRKVEDCKTMIRAYDEDGDGRICFQEFMGMLALAA